jgi:hypothetical protein
MTTPESNPVRLEGRLDPDLSRWLWLVKWLLAIPHYVVLFFLWIAFFVLSVVVFFAILVTGALPAWDLRFQSRGAALDVAGRVLFLWRAGDGSVSALLARVGAGVPGDPGGGVSG